MSWETALVIAGASAVSGAVLAASGWAKSGEKFSGNKFWLTVIVSGVIGLLQGMVGVDEFAAVVGSPFYAYVLQSLKKYIVA